MLARPLRNELSWIPCDLNTARDKVYAVCECEGRRRVLSAFCIVGRCFVFVGISMKQTQTSGHFFALCLFFLSVLVSLVCDTVSSLFEAYSNLIDYCYHQTPLLLSM